MNTNGGNVIYHFKGDTSDLDKKTKDTESSLGGLKSVAKSAMLGVGAAVVGATAAVAGLTKESVNAYAEFEQLEGGLVSMMHGNEQAIQSVIDTSKNAYKDLQMSQNDYLNAFESSYAIIQNGLSENADAIEYTNKTLQLSADLFNTYGGSTEQYANAINWALKGTFSYLDNLNLGIKGTQEGFIEAANASGVLGREIDSVKDITNDEIIDVIQHYAEKAGAWGKSQQEASTTIIGSINMVKSAFADFMSGQGGVEQVITSFTVASQNIVGAITNLLPKLIEGITGLIQGILPMLPDLLKSLLPGLITGVIELIKGIIQVLPDIIEMIAEMLPTILPMLVDGIMEIIPMLIDMIPLFLECGAKLLGGLIAGIINSLPSLLMRLVQSALGILNVFSDIPGKMLNIGKNIASGLWNGIKGMKGWVIGRVKSMGKDILNGLKSVLGIHSPSKEFAIIGKYSILGYTEQLDKMKGQLQDAVQDTFSLSPELIGNSSLHYSPNVVVNNNISSKTDPLGQVVTNIKTFANGAKNDYNYGMGV